MLVEAVFSKQTQARVAGAAVCSAHLWQIGMFTHMIELVAKQCNLNIHSSLMSSPRAYLSAC